MADTDQRPSESDDDYLARKQSERQWASLTENDRALHGKSLSKNTKHDVKPKEA